MIELKGGEYIANTKEILGQGNYGYVFKCQKKDCSQKYVAKVIKKEKLKKLGQYAKTLLKREIEIHKTVSESGIPYFVKLEDSFYEKKNLILIMERCDYDLEKLLKRKISTSLATQLTFQIAVGILFLHNMDIIHRDIKPGNIMVKNNTIKIGDFGFATNDKLAETNLGSLPYQAPEIFVADEGKAYDNKVDVWALNTIFYKLLTKQFYYKPTQDRDLYHQKLVTKKFVFPDQFEVDDKIKDLITQGYQADPRKRPDILQYIYHPLFQNLREEYSFIVHKSQHSKMIGQQNNQQKIKDKWFIKMENFLKINHFYLDLAEELKQLEGSSVLRAFLMKRALQMLSLVYLKFQKQQQIPLLSFIESDDDWKQFYNHDNFKKIHNKLKNLIKLNSKKFISLQQQIDQEHKGQKNEVYRRNIEVIFDLNQDIDMKTFNYYLEKTSIKTDEQLSANLAKIKNWENGEDKNHYFNQDKFQRITQIEEKENVQNLFKFFIKGNI